MLEVTRTVVGVVTASAAPGALDALIVPGRAFACRTADDELSLLSAPQVTDEVAREVATRLAVDMDEGGALATVDQGRRSLRQLFRPEKPEHKLAVLIVGAPQRFLLPPLALIAA